jgi:hypothetical protein
VSDGALPGRQPVIPRKIESEIAQRATQAASMVLGMSKLQLLHKVGRVTKELKLLTPFKKNVPGKDSFTGVCSIETPFSSIFQIVCGLWSKSFLLKISARSIK